MEIERKWLIDGFPAGLPLLKEARVRQGYISTAPVVRIRESVNADGCRCVLCFKGEGTLAREEVETDISAELFRRLTAFTGQDLVTKDYRVYALPGGERLEVSLVDAGRPTAFFYAEVEFPTVSTEELEECMFRDVLGTYTTKCAGPWGRHQNIKLAAAAINGRIYNPGEEFWYNSAVGQRTAARGYQEAGVYEGGRTTTGIGGGICQVSSTLYYAVLLSDLDIVLRYCHMFNPGYMPIGCDATVSWGGPDFAFRNSRDYPIKIVTSYNDNTNEVTCTILGTKVDDHYVVMTNAVLGVTDYQTVYQESPDVAPGEEVIDQYGHTGYYVRTWRNIYDGDGNLLSSRVEADSHYDVGNKIILVAPGYLPGDSE